MSRSNKVILPGATLGVMGGGQLGRMFAHAAQAMGYAVAVVDPDPISPAGMLAQYHINTDYLDEQGLAQCMQRCDAVTIEFENVPAGALHTIGAHRPTAPHADAVALCQDRRLEKAHFLRVGVPCAPYAVIESEADLTKVEAGLFPGILKTARLGYDGRGQVSVDDAAGLTQAWATLKQQACVLEARLDLRAELSVILARSAEGDMVHLPVQHNLHRDGILAVTTVPCTQLEAGVLDQAIDQARSIAQGLEHVGVLCVEFFVLKDGRLLANEMAPRPHNSGHHSIDACDVSQFDLQVRALTGLPLTQPRQHSAAVMLNVLGDLWRQENGKDVAPAWAEVLALPGVHLHLYGKTQARPGRKMGHLTVTAASPEAALAQARKAGAILGMPSW